MAGPWEKYQGAPSTPAEPVAGPWAKYASATPSDGPPIVDLPAVQAQRPDFSDVSANVDSTGDKAFDWRSLPYVVKPSQMHDGTLGEFLGGHARDAGRSVRSALRGVGGVLDILGEPVAQAIDYLTQPSDGTERSIQRQVRFRELGDMGADTLGLPSPETAGQRVVDDIGQALSGTAATMGVGGVLGATRAAASNPTLGEMVSGTLLAQPRLQVASAVTGAGASGLTREAGGGTGSQVAAGVLGSLAPAGVTAGLPAATRGVLRGGEGNRQALERTLGDFDAVGATPSIGQGTGNWARQGFESLLTGAPTSGGVMRRFAERQADEIGEGLQARANQLSPRASAEQAGRAVERGVDTFANNVRAMKKALYWRADKAIPETTALPLASTQRALAELTMPTAGAEATTGALINPKIREMMENVGADLEANGGVMPYSAVKELRSRIGEELSDFSLAPDKPTAQYKRLYAALSQDMEEAARAQGPDAERFMRRANTYTRASSDRLEQVQRVVDKNGGPEKVFNAVMSGTKDGGTTLRAVMQSLPEEGQRAVTAAVIKRMGLANPGAQDAAGDTFNAATFLTNWNRISPEAKRALFDRHGPTFTHDMGRIARVAQSIKDGSEVFRNPAGTANRGMALTYAGGLAGAILTGQIELAGAAAVGGAISNALARGLTNPNIVRWLAKATEMPVGALPAQINVLNRIAEAKDDPEVAEFAEALSQQAANPQQQEDYERKAQNDK